MSDLFSFEKKTTKKHEIKFHKISNKNSAFPGLIRSNKYHIVYRIKMVSKYSQIYTGQVKKKIKINQFGIISVPTFPLLFFFLQCALYTNGNIASRSLKYILFLNVSA